MVNHPNRGGRVGGPHQNPTTEAIVAARVQANMTQLQAATLIYSTLTNWQSWEAGSKRMHPAFFELFLIKTKQHA
jgi:hypothetical protein